MKFHIPRKLRRFAKSKAAVALPITFLILFVSTLGIVAFTYYFAVEKINSQSQTLKATTAKENFLDLATAIESTMGQPGSSTRVDVLDNGGRLRLEPTENNLQLSLSYGSPKNYSTYNPSRFSLLNSTGYLSGTLTDLQSKNNVALTFESGYTATDTNNYYPSDSTLLGSTTSGSGSVANLQQTDATYMNLRSYPSATSPTAKTDAFIAYRDSLSLGLTYPKTRQWTGDTTTWSADSQLSNAESTVRWIRTAACPITQRSQEKAVVALSDDGYLDAYIFDGTSWAVTNDIANVGTTANQYKCFDVTYEKTSGDILLVYSIAPNSNFQLGYKTYNPTSGWSNQNTYTLSASTTQTAYWVSMAQKPTSGADEIAVGIIGDSTALDAYGLIWNGASFTSQQLLTGTVSIATRECIAVEYEQTSGYATFISSTGNNAFSWQWSGSTWDASAMTFDLSTTSVPNWFTLKANPVNDELFAVCVDASSDLNTAYWSGSSWTLHTEHDASIDSYTQRCTDFAWETTGSKGLLVWGTTAGQIAYRTFTAPNTWGTTQNVAMGANIHPWVQLRTNPRNIAADQKILGAVMEGTVFDIGAIEWDGTTFTIVGTSTISTSITAITYECFELDFLQFGKPTEYTCATTLSGSSDPQSCLQLIWTITSHSTATDTTATLQLYNYNTDQYAESGNGYITGTVSTLDSTLSQTISANPAYFCDGTGNWIMKITLVKTVSQQFDWACDFASFAFSESSQQTCAVEFSGESNTASWTELVWSTDLSFNTTDVTATLQLYNYATHQFSTVGNGYLDDLLGQTSVTKTQSISTNPTDFRDTDGSWKVKLTATKATDIPFKLQVDLVEYKATSDSGYSQVTDNIYNSAIGQIIYELPYIRDADFGFYLKGDSRALINQTGASMTQLSIQNGSRSAEIMLGYRPKLTYTITGIEDNHIVNDIRVYLVNLNVSQSVAMYGKVPLKISCQSAQITTNTYIVSSSINELTITSTMAQDEQTISVPISTSTEGAIIHVQLVISNLQLERTVA
jgi:hypothetical protein